MAWGGSLNKEGSDYIRKLKEVEKIIHFLESVKNSLQEGEKEKVTEVIDIITTHFKSVFEKE